MQTTIPIRFPPSWAAKNVKKLPQDFQGCFAWIKVCKIFIHLLTGTLGPSIKRNIFQLPPGELRDRCPLDMRGADRKLLALHFVWLLLTPLGYSLSRREGGEQFFLLNFQMNVEPSPLFYQQVALPFISALSSLLCGKEKLNRAL